MVPESTRANAVRLYIARDFPNRWELLVTLLEGSRFADSSLFRWHDRWWLFAETSADVSHTTLRLFTAERLIGPWNEHPKSPIVAADGRSLARAVRVAGKVEPLFVESVPEMRDAVLSRVRDGDVVVTMGAGSVGGLAPELAVPSPIRAVRS